MPAFNEGDNLRANIGVVSEWLLKSNVDYEIIIVDDGSRDLTWSVCRQLAESSDAIRAIRFSRNFGKESAILCGLKEALGDAAIVIDSDLQHPPEIIPQMLQLW